MKRLQTKCFVAAALVHGLLAVALLVGPGFVGANRTANDLTILDVIPAKLVDDVLSGGGTPGNPPPAPIKTIATPLPPSPAPPLVKPAPPEPKPAPVVEKTPVRTPEPPPEETPKPKSNEPDNLALDPEKSVKPRPKKATELTKNELLTKKIARPNEDSESDTQTAKRAADKARKEAATAAAAWSKELKGALGTIRGGLSSGVSIGPMGQGGTGGEAYANYEQAIMSIYDHAWIDPNDVVDESLSVKTVVVIRRDGEVLSWRIVRRSGNDALDNSVTRALARVKRVPAFPTGAKEEQRSYPINFNLKARRPTG